MISNIIHKKNICESIKCPCVVTDRVRMFTGPSSVMKVNMIIAVDLVESPTISCIREFVNRYPVSDKTASRCHIKGGACLI